MADEQLFDGVRNIDARLMRVEQILPGLATRDELQAGIAPLATREELQAAIVPLATRAELQAAIAPLATRAELQAAIAPLATREELHAALHAWAQQLRAEIKEEGERSRRCTDVMIEDLRDDNRLILEHLIALSARVDALAQR
jgi:hypothetical protein